MEKETVKKRIEGFRTALKVAGIKLTHQRLQIFRRVISSTNHPTADEIYKDLHKSMPMLSLDTVYRTLWMLTDLGLISKLGTRNDSSRFDANQDRHHHFTCLRCGAIQDFHNHQLDNLKLPEEAQALGQVESYQVEVKGLCKSCMQQEREKPELDTLKS